MVKMNECKKRFNKIVQGKENEGYIEWKKWVLKEIEDYDDNKMENIKKRYEIRMKMAEKDDGFRVFSMVTHIVAILVAMIPFLGNVTFTALSTNISAYSFENDSMRMQEFGNIVNNVIQEMVNSLVKTATLSFVLLCIVLCVAKYVDACYVSGRNKNRIFYEEMLSVLEKEIARRKNVI